MLRAAASVAAIALITAGGASAEVVARGIQDGLLALDAKGAPEVAWVHHSTLFIGTRPGPHRWVRAATASVPPGSSAVAFEIGAAGPVALVQSGDDRTIELVRRRSVGWQTIRIAKVGALFRLGWPGLALDRKGQPVVAYTRWNAPTLKSRLLISRVDAKGHISTRRITQEGFPKSFVPPPAEPLLFGDVAHVVESYGYRGVVGTIEWFPKKKDWVGLGLDAGIGDYPVGPVFAGLSANGVLHAAWTESMLSFDFEAAPVTLVERHRFASSVFVLDRALTSALVLPSTGPEVAANQWIGESDFGSLGDAELWAGTIVRGRSKAEVDGWISGFASSRRARPVAGRPGRAALVPRAGAGDDPGVDRGRGRRRIGLAQRPRGRCVQRHRDHLPRAPWRVAHGGRAGSDQRRRVLVRRRSADAAARLPRGLHGPLDGRAVRGAATQARRVERLAAGADGLAEGLPLVAEPAPGAGCRQQLGADEQRPHQRRPEGEPGDHQRRAHLGLIGWWWRSV